jgi:hypothetical protein
MPRKFMLLFLCAHDISWMPAETDVGQAHNGCFTGFATGPVPR